MAWSLSRIGESGSGGRRKSRRIWQGVEEARSGERERDDDVRITGARAGGSLKGETMEKGSQKKRTWLD
jgi:hypothetical protein